MLPQQEIALSQSTKDSFGPGEPLPCRPPDLPDSFLATIVECSDDAIYSIDLDGIITSWNKGAERLLGYAADETVGKPVTMLIPVDRHEEETEILEFIKRGQRIDHYETVRQRKDGSLVEISLTVSPITTGEFGTEQHDLRRIINLDQKHDERRRRAIRRIKSLPADVESDKELCQFE